jgi:hypothetical protein
MVRSGCECCDGCGDKDVRVSFCPKCKSVKVKYVFGLGNLFGVIPRMRCGECGFDSQSFPVLVTTEKKLGAGVESLKKKVGKKVRKKVIPTRQSVPLKGRKKKVVKRK